jgi:hypothetical protein
MRRIAVIVLENALMRLVGDLWLDNHNSVLFHEGEPRVTGPAARSRCRTALEKST